MKTCIGCGDQLSPPSVKWCSPECRKKHYKRETLIGTCEECNKEYEYAVYRKGRTRFCSPQCVGANSARKVNAPRKATRVTLNCKTCGKEYWRTPYQAKRSNYCSKKCNGKSSFVSYKNGAENPNYKSGIRDYHNKALDFHGKSCKICHSKQNIEVHHIDANRKNNEIDNLVPLCSKCHHQIHGFARRGLNLFRFFDECPSDAVYYNYILPLIQALDKKRVLRSMKKPTREIHDVSCEFCGKQYSEIYSKVKRTRFCSRSCQGKYAWEKAKKS